MLTCPNGCTIDDETTGTETPAEMEFGYTSKLAGRDTQPAYICGQCGVTELQRDRGQL